MAKTAVTVTSVTGTYQQATELTVTSGDLDNDHSIDLSNSPRLILLTYNTGANAIVSKFELPACKSTYNEALEISMGVNTGVLKGYVLDFPPDARQSGNVAHLTSADADFPDIRLAAYTYGNTPKR